MIDDGSKLHLVEGEHGFPRRVTTATAATTATRCFQVSRLEPLTFLLLRATSVCGSSPVSRLIYYVYGLYMDGYAIVGLSWIGCSLWLHCFMAHEWWFMYRSATLAIQAKCSSFATISVCTAGIRNWESQERKQGCSRLFNSFHLGLTITFGLPVTPSLSLHKTRKEQKHAETLWTNSVPICKKTCKGE